MLHTCHLDAFLWQFPFDEFAALLNCPLPCRMSCCFKARLNNSNQFSFILRQTYKQFVDESVQIAVQNPRRAITSTPTKTSVYTIHWTDNKNPPCLTIALSLPSWSAVGHYSCHRVKWGTSHACLLFLKIRFRQWVVCVWCKRENSFNFNLYNNWEINQIDYSLMFVP